MLKSVPVSNGPTLPGQRIISLDALRGFAMLGILSINIQMFALISSEFDNPLALGPLSWPNHLVYFLVNVFVSGKFLRLFAMLFGAGICMMTQKLSERGKNPAPRHYSRMFWLFAIGFANAVLISYNDILKLYAMAGLIVFLLRKLPPKKLLILGITILIAVAVKNPFSQPAPSLTPRQLEASIKRWHPDPKMVEREFADNLEADWAKSVSGRFAFETNIKFRYSLRSLIGSIPGTLAMMLIGMALFKWGILSGRASNRLYRKLLLWGLGLGVLWPFLGWLINYLHGWDYFLSFRKNFAIPDPWLESLKYFITIAGSIGICLGYIGGSMLLYKSGRLQRIFNWLAAVGRMALTNYLLQNLACVWIFLGYGLGLFGKLDRIGLVLVVLGLSFLQIRISTLWLKYFRFGPLEWLWRSLTYWKLQPMKK